MLGRREFLGGLSGLLMIRRAKEKTGTPVQIRERPEESVQELIEQIRILEREVKNRKHIEAIQDQIRVRLLLAGMACKYIDEDGRKYICALETSTGFLWALPYGQSSLPWAKKAWEQIGLKGLESRVRDLPMACNI